jgi:diguanylate cyclase (GGDEF)-like protein/PAS domain S-box-containing protein
LTAPAAIARLLRHRSLAWLGAWVLVVLACVLAGLARWPPPAQAAAGLFWPAAGVALAALVRLGNPAWPAVLLGLTLAHGGLGVPPWLALGLASGSTASAWAASRWLRQARFDRQLERRRDLWLLLSVAALGASLVSATNTVLWLAAAGRLSLLQLPLTALQTWVGEALGLVAAGVPLMTLTRRSLADALAPGSRARTVALLTASTGAVALAFLAPESLGAATPVLALLPLVLLSWLAMRSGLALPSAAALLLGSAMFAGTAAGLGPFAQPPAAAGTWLLWGHVAALVALVLLTHAQVGELARREARWQLAVDGSDLGVADWDLRTGGHFSSPRWRALMVDPSGELTSSLERWLAQVHADDRVALRSALSAVATPASSGLRREVRVRVRDAWCWFDAHVSVTERDPQGQPLRVVASVTDIGARRNAEDRQQLSSNVFQHLHEGLVVTDADMRVLDANPAYCQIAGLPREQLIGTVPALLQPVHAEVSQREQLAHLWTGLRNEGHWVGELATRGGNGEPGAMHVTVSAVQGPEGKLRHHVLVITDVTEHHRQRERLARQAHFDELTQLPNRARLAQLMAEAMAATDRDGYLLAVCYLDLDRFKAINDLHGHEVGNQLLAEVANRLRSTLRTRGHSWTDAAARLGGDEFVLLLRASTVDEARAAVERVLRVVSLPVVLRPDSLPEVVTASVGATVYPLDASDADTLLRHADHAMFGAKQSGRNGYLFFDPENSRRHQERVLALGRVQEALDRNELVLYYQPKVDLRRGVVLGFEALLRWNHPQHGVLPPSQFLPLIENTGLSASVGDHVLARAIDQLMVWKRQGLDLTVSVNISARHLQMPDFAQRLAELLGRQAEPLGPRLELEVLETAALQDIGFTSVQLERCARLGVRWALDDFGTGYSTLTYLKRLPVQVLKIDRSFVHNMLADSQDRAIVEGVISLARTFGCTAVAEGVETQAQARMLLDMGCDIGQGTGIAAPMPAAEVAPWVREWAGLFVAADSMRPAAGPATGPAVPALSAWPPAGERG